MNDPHGLVFADGMYHAFFQYVPRDTAWQSDLHWGHAISRDAVQWHHRGSALVPADGEVGCWSGSLVIAEQPTIFYTNPSTDDWGRGQIVRAIGSADLSTWTHDGVVIDGQPEDRFRDFRDPQVRRSENGWTMVVGAGIREDGGCVLQYSSADLRSWTYDGVIASAAYEPDATLNLGNVWECPQFLNIGGTWVLMISAMVAGEKYQRQLYALGDYDGRVFTPRKWGDYGHGDLPYATTTFMDADGVPSAMSWLRETPETLPEGSPWAGAQSIVHHLRIEGDKLLAPFHPNLDAVLPAAPINSTADVDFGTAVRFLGDARGTIMLRDAAHAVKIVFDTQRVTVFCDDQSVLDARCDDPTSLDLVADADWLEFVCGNVEGIFVAKIPPLGVGSISNT